MFTAVAKDVHQCLKWLIGSWLLFCIVSHIVIALPTIAIAIVVAILRS